jgi:hypothetical protein
VNLVAEYLYDQWFDYHLQITMLNHPMLRMLMYSNALIDAIRNKKLNVNMYEIFRDYVIGHADMIVNSNSTCGFLTPNEVSDILSIDVGENILCQGSFAEYVCFYNRTHITHDIYAMQTLMLNQNDLARKMLARNVVIEYGGYSTALPVLLMMSSHRFIDETKSVTHANDINISMSETTAPLFDESLDGTLKVIRTEEIDPVFNIRLDMLNPMIGSTLKTDGLAMLIPHLDRYCESTYNDGYVQFVAHDVGAKVSVPTRSSMRGVWWASQSANKCEPGCLKRVAFVNTLKHDIDISPLLSEEMEWVELSFDTPHKCEGKEMDAFIELFTKKSSTISTILMHNVIIHGNCMQWIYENFKLKCVILINCVVNKAEKSSIYSLSTLALYDTKYDISYDGINNIVYMHDNVLKDLQYESIPLHNGHVHIFFNDPLIQIPTIFVDARTTLRDKKTLHIYSQQTDISEYSFDIATQQTTYRPPELGGHMFLFHEYLDFGDESDNNSFKNCVCGCSYFAKNLVKIDTMNPNHVHFVAAACRLFPRTRSTEVKSRRNHEPNYVVRIQLQQNNRNVRAYDMLNISYSIQQYAAIVDLNKPRKSVSMNLLRQIWAREYHLHRPSFCSTVQCYPYLTDINEFAKYVGILDEHREKIVGEVVSLTTDHDWYTNVNWMVHVLYAAKFLAGSIYPRSVMDVCTMSIDDMTSSAEIYHFQHQMNICIDPKQYNSTPEFKSSSAQFVCTRIVIDDDEFPPKFFNENFSKVRCFHLTSKITEKWKKLFANMNPKSMFGYDVFAHEADSVLCKFERLVIVIDEPTEYISELVKSLVVYWYDYRNRMFKKQYCQQKKNTINSKFNFDNDEVYKQALKEHIESRESILIYMPVLGENSGSIKVDFRLIENVPSDYQPIRDEKCKLTLWRNLMPLDDAIRFGFKDTPVQPSKEPGFETMASLFTTRLLP